LHRDLDGSPTRRSSDLELESQDVDITVALVSARVQLSPATVSRILDRLVKADLVIRERGKRDRRRVKLALTPAGYERFQTLPTPDRKSTRLNSSHVNIS